MFILRKTYVIYRAGNKYLIKSTLYKTRLLIDTMQVHGCGCYSLHSQRYGGGSKRLISSLNGMINSKHLGFSKARSIYRIPCPRTSS